MKLISLMTLAAAASTVSALDITFRRFSRRGCDQEGGEHIAADTHLHDPHCKSFDMDEPVFYSFQILHEDDSEDLNEKFCYATVYDGQDCNGKAVYLGDMKNYIGEGTCGDTHLPARSVRISCDKNESTATRLIRPTPTTTSITHVDTPITRVDTPCTTVHDRPLPTTTVTLVPAHQHEGDCEDCDDWRW